MRSYRFEGVAANIKIDSEYDGVVELFEGFPEFEQRHKGPKLGLNSTRAGSCGCVGEEEAKATAKAVETGGARDLYTSFQKNCS